MTALGRLLLVGVVIVTTWAIVLAALWASFVAGVWLAVHVTEGPTLTQALTGLALAVVLVMMARAVHLLIETVREEPQA